MNLKGNFFDDKLRRAIRASALGVVPETHVDEVVDLGLNAAEQAIEALSRLTVDLNSGPVGLSALGIALSLVRYRAGELEGILRDATASIGAPHSTVMVTVE